MFYHVAKEKGFCTVNEILAHANQNQKVLMPVEMAVLYAEAGEETTKDSRIVTFIRNCRNTIISLVK